MNIADSRSVLRLESDPFMFTTDVSLPDVRTESPQRDLNPRSLLRQRSALGR